MRTADGHEAPDDRALTLHQLAVANLVSGGLTNSEAANELGVSVKTIEYHLGKVFAKLGVRSRSQLALRMNGVTPHPASIGVRGRIPSSAPRRQD